MKAVFVVALMMFAMMIKSEDETAPPYQEPVLENENDVNFPGPNPENTATEQVECPQYAHEQFITDYYEYLKTHKKAYKCEDFRLRYFLYAERRKAIEEFNRRSDVTYVQGTNALTDLTDEERSRRYLGIPDNDPDNHTEYERDTGSDAEIEQDIENEARQAAQDAFTANIFNIEIFRPALLSFDFLCCLTNPFGVPCKKDWQTLGKVTSVKNQLSCGSCWAFAAIAAMESGYLINYATSLNLSEQELVSCATAAWGNYGCGGGWPHKALNYIISQRIIKEIYFPYTASNSPCPLIFPAVYKYPAKSKTMVLPQNRMDTFLQALNQRPIAVAFKVTSGFYSYSSGIYDPSFDAACGTPGINHAVLAVGYSLGCKPYIRFKNSWGTSFGESGYFRMKLSKTIFQDGPCQLINHPYNVYPKV